MGLTMNERKSLVRETAGRYQRAGKKQKGHILEEFKAIVKQIGLAPELFWMNMADSQKFMKGLYDSMKPVVEQLGLGN